MNHVERFNALMNFQEVDRLPKIEWAGYWGLSTDRWREEGLDPKIEGAEHMREHLGLDPYSQFWMAPGSKETPKPTHHGSGILKDEAEYDAMLHTLYNVPDFSNDRYKTVSAENVCVPQFMTVAEDMSYNHGPMCSKEQFDEFHAPYYKRLVAALKERGIRVLVDSDGDVMPLIPWLKEVGVEGILPLERMAGVDVARIRSEHISFSTWMSGACHAPRG